MHHHYLDITCRIPYPPKWFDENAVPRYSDFSPSEVADIYANEVALAEIACQNCRKRFKVAFSQNSFRAVLATVAGRNSRAGILAARQGLRMGARSGV